MKGRWLPLIVSLLLAGALALVVDDFVHQLLVAPFLYVSWFVTLLLGSVAQVLYWGVFILVTLIIVASKSGSTIEVMSFYKYFYAKVLATKGEAAGQNFVAITDPDSPLDKLAQEMGFRHVFRNPPDIGGRYSALSYFGLAPAALLGLDVPQLLERAAQIQVDE